ncbi:hypothetical protein ACLIA0_07240 [Bacillaceae bacterium W0354]
MSALPLPKSFDANEWFVIISLIVSYYILWLFRKKMKTSHIILIILYSATIARIADHSLAGPPIDGYDLMDTGKFELFDGLTYFLYGPFGFFFISIFQKLNVKGLSVLFYILVWATISVFYEWITVLFGVFTFTDWKSIYSFPIYLFTQSLTLLFYYFVLNKHSSDDQGALKN